MSAEVCLMLATQKKWIRKEMFFSQTDIWLCIHYRYQPCVTRKSNPLEGTSQARACHRPSWRHSCRAPRYPLSQAPDWLDMIILHTYIIFPGKYFFNRVYIHCNALYRVQLFSKYASGLLRGSIIINSQFVSKSLVETKKYKIFLQVEKQMDN